MTLAFKPGMTGDLAAALVAHAEYDARWYAAARKIAMEHRGAFPADWRED